MILNLNKVQLMRAVRRTHTHEYTYRWEDVDLDPVGLHSSLINQILDPALKCSKRLNKRPG